MVKAQSYDQAQEWIEKNRQQFHLIGFFGNFSASSRNTLPVFEAFVGANPSVPVLVVDVGQVKGIHGLFGVTTVPTVISVKDGKIIQKVEGPRDINAYDRALLAQTPVINRSGESKEPPTPRVTVYVGAHCVWCTRVKNYLRENRIRFTEIDVSKDPDAAKTLVAKTGQQGVPQLDINGQWVVGFDKPKINSLLGLKAA